MIEPAFPSSPFRPPRVAIRVDVGPRLLIQTFYGTYAAKRFIEAVEEILGDSATIRSDGTKLEVIRAHKYTREEEQWQLPDHMRREIEALSR